MQQAALSLFLTATVASQHEAFDEATNDTRD